MPENPREIRETIDGLREEIRRIERRPPQRACFTSSGRPEIDALLPGGGFPRGALAELAGGPASGKTGVVLSALAHAMGTKGLAAFVDGRGELYPPAVTLFGVDLARLLVVRPLAPERGAGESVRYALWAAEALLASGAFEAVAMDVPVERVRAREQIERARVSALDAASLDRMFLRLRAAAEKGGGVALWLGLPQGARVPSAARLELSAGAAGVQVRRAFARGAAGAPLTEWQGTSPCPSPLLDASHAA
jgi:protein ImuA